MEKEMIKILQKDIEIPKVVQERAENAFAEIYARSRGKSGENEEERERREAESSPEGMERKREAAKKKQMENKGKENGTEERRMDMATGKTQGKSRGKRKNGAKRGAWKKTQAAAVFMAIVFACGGITAAAAYIHWSKSMEEGMQITEEQKVQLEEEHAVAFAMQECTTQGVTITAEQSITDNYFAHIVFRVDGYEVGEEEEPAFEKIRIHVDGKEDFYNWWGSFYDGLIAGPDGRAVYADGSPIDYESDGMLGKYVMEDGSMEFTVTLACHEKGELLDKQIHVELENLGTVAKAEYLDTKVEGTWEFDWNLRGKESVETFVLQAELGDSGATVTKAELSPISMHVEYHFPLKEITEEGLDENGEVIYTKMNAEPPSLVGVKLKDGTLYPYLTDGGSMGYEEGDLETYIATFATDRIVDVEQVEGLLFWKSSSEGAPTEDNFYVVPIR